jgi:mannosyltransferase OCH1-like enzyme
MFPKIIHQIWMQGETNVPRHLAANAAALRRMHSEWRYILWDESMLAQLVATNNEWERAYNALDYLHQRADFGRYIILVVCGGVYIDMDVEPRLALDPLLDEHKDAEVVLSRTNSTMATNIFIFNSTHSVNNGIIISRPGALFMRCLVQSIAVADNSRHALVARLVPGAVQSRDVHHRREHVHDPPA